jgi:hypothetical protein
MERQSKKRKVNLDYSAATLTSSSSNDDPNIYHPSRFEAYKRCTISRSDALSNFITACLIHSHKVTNNRKVNNLSLIGGGGTCTGNGNGNGNGIGIGNNNGKETTGDNDNTGSDEATSHKEKEKSKTNQYHEGGNEKTNPRLENNEKTTSSLYLNNSNDNNNNHNILHNPLNNDIASISKLKLPDIVAPGAASKITSVVSTLSKIHAQRLIKSARAIATSQGYQENEKILPCHLMEAHRVMTQYGGVYGASGGGTFFMEPAKKQMKGLSTHSLGRSGNLDGHCSVAFGGIDKNLIQYQAAMEAQKQYDEIIMMNQSNKQEEAMEEADDDCNSENNVNDLVDCEKDTNQA